MGFNSAFKGLSVILLLLEILRFRSLVIARLHDKLLKILMPSQNVLV